jgi:hypothetical protein
MFVNVADQDVEVHKVIANIPGDPTIGVFETTAQVVFDDGFAVGTSDDYDYLMEEIRILVLNLYGKNARCHMVDMDGNKVYK